MIVQDNRPDPYPGRCECIKFNAHPGVMQYERCLGYAYEEHICTFENYRPPVAYTTRTEKTDPPAWVAPWDE